VGAADIGSAGNPFEERPAIICRVDLAVLVWQVVDLRTVFRHPLGRYHNDPVAAYPTPTAPRVKDSKRKVFIRLINVPPGAALIVYLAGLEIRGEYPGVEQLFY
jgi:hypothetical protein